MPTFIDDFLNRTTMYRLVLYYLLVLWIVAFVFSAVGMLPFNPVFFVISGLIILIVCWIANNVFARAFGAQTNVESIYITVLILTLIISPLSTAGIGSSVLEQIWFLVWASVWAMASKYIFAIGKKHIFNPAAFAVALTAIVLGQSANWWIGTAIMLPFVCAGGLLVAKKLHRFDTIISFLIVALAGVVGFGVLRGTGPISTLGKVLLDSPIIFFSFVMLTEPLTAPPTKMARRLYGVLIGALFAPSIHIGSIYSTPELALLAGNIFSYFVSPKEKLVLTLKEKISLTPNIYDFVFSTDRSISFKPGQYLEWTRGHDHTDNRGNRRYFTISSSPTEPEIHIGVKFYPEASSFKKSLMSMRIGDALVAGQRAGDFILPKDPQQKLVFLAGGIGITPFRSMVKYLLDRNDRRSITLLYSNKTNADIAYKNIFDEAEIKLGMKSAYIATESQGPITPNTIVKEVPDYQERIFYISGPHAMVHAFEKTLKDLGVKRNHIKTDFFPGFV